MSREKGDKLEDFVSYHTGIKKTTNSGAKYDNADLSNRRFIIECKYKDKSSFQPCGTELKKLMAQADKHGKDWIYIQENQGGIQVVIDWALFIEMWKLYTVSY